MKKIIVEDDQVATLHELAETLSKDYGWTKYVVHADCIEFYADGSDGKPVHATVDSTGFAENMDGDADISEFDVDWCECFDAWSDRVWAYDDDGRTVVMIHD